MSEIKLTRVAKTIIRRALREDLGKRGDITTRATIPSDTVGEAVIIAREGGIIAGQRIAEGVFKAVESSLLYRIIVPDGKSVEPGTEIARIKGKFWAILVAERTALNILGRCCGIATLTDKYVKAVAGTKAKITETRKTAPGLRYIDKASVLVGGGVNHRYALHDAFLIKENHIKGAGGIVEAIKACKDFRAKWGRFRIMVEATDLDEYKLALSAEPERILLDNMTPDQLKACVDVSHANIELEATGGITLDNVRGYAETGVDFISIGALTHSVKALDLSLLLTG
ncbi:MAG: carboxylating nicotinate-nucleotide diphosphorylase [Calditrichaeota bacterium]|nr:carboxylating nicotinate-nucleotide diphosphorylase [Calditrichota bacterium]